MLIHDSRNHTTRSIGISLSFLTVYVKERGVFAAVKGVAAQPNPESAVRRQRSSAWHTAPLVRHGRALRRLRLIPLPGLPLEIFRHDFKEFAHGGHERQWIEAHFPQQVAVDCPCPLDHRAQIALQHIPGLLAFPAQGLVHLCVEAQQSVFVLQDAIDRLCCNGVSAVSPGDSQCLQRLRDAIQCAHFRHPFVRTIEKHVRAPDRLQDQKAGREYYIPYLQYISMDYKNYFLFLFGLLLEFPLDETGAASNIVDGKRAKCHSS